jgi:hypothetical protein
MESAMHLSLPQAAWTIQTIAVRFLWCRGYALTFIVPEPAGAVDAVARYLGKNSHYPDGFTAHFALLDSNIVQWRRRPAGGFSSGRTNKKKASRKNRDALKPI